VIESFEKDEFYKILIEEAFKHSFNEMHFKFKEQYPKKYAGTTVVSVFSYISLQSGKRLLHCANVGDSRAIFVRSNRSHPIRISFDHKPACESEKLRIEIAGGNVSMGRLNGVLAVSRAIGDNFLEPVGLISDPHVRMIQIDPEDNDLDRNFTHLVLATDGLWDVFTDVQVKNYVCNYISDAEGENIDYNSMSKELCEMAYKKGSMDNITVLIRKL
jgi:serine/threonine protein phosphatase PrpC